MEEHATLLEKKLAKLNFLYTSSPIPSVFSLPFSWSEFYRYYELDWTGFCNRKTVKDTVFSFISM